jgi:hypothetical protein
MDPQLRYCLLNAFAEFCEMARAVRLDEVKVSKFLKGNTMTRTVALIIASFVSSISMASAQVELKTYTDANGYIDVQKLTCGQLANTFQEDADFLTAWYSGWYNGLAKKHVMKVDRAKQLEHELIVHCKANPGKKIIQAIDVVFKEYRAQQGIKVK